MGLHPNFRDLELDEVKASRAQHCQRSLFGDPPVRGC